jgi:hypothetical protein
LKEDALHHVFIDTPAAAALRRATVFSTHFLQELFMTSLVRSSPAWRSPPKIILALAFLVSQVPVQAAAPEPPPQAKPNDSGPVIVSTEPGKIPHKHRETKRGPVKPEKYPTKPQQPVRSLR